MTSINYSSACLSCGKQSLIPYITYTPILTKTRGHIGTLVISSLICISILFSIHLLDMIVSLSGGVALFVSYITLRKKYKRQLERFHLQDILLRNRNAILQGLTIDLDHAVKEIQTANVKAAYEALREVGRFLLNDKVKLLKVHCLNRIVLRKDMELELDSVVPSIYDFSFIEYLYEISKVNKQLIRQQTLDYVADYRENIEALEFGQELMINICSAALRLKIYAVSYQNLIIDYMALLPKERFLRLCKMIAANNETDWKKLGDQARQTIKVKYDYDPDFQGIL